MNQPKLPVLASVVAAYAFLLEHWRSLIILAVPYLVTKILTTWADASFGNDAPAMMQVPLLLLWIAGMLATLVFLGGAFRLALSGERLGWQGLSLGRPEGRILAVMVLIVALFGLVFVLGLVGLLGLANAIGLGVMESVGLSQEEVDANIFILFEHFGWTENSILIIATFGVGTFLAWLLARLMMAFPATIDRGRIQVLSVWPLSQGHAIRIALAHVLSVLPLTLLLYGLYEGLSAMMGERLLAMPHMAPADIPTPEIWVLTNELWRVGDFVSVITIPVLAGLYAYVYKGLVQIHTPRDASE